MRQAADEQTYDRRVEPYRASCRPTATGCSARLTTPRTPLQETLLRAWRSLPTFAGPELAALVAVHDRDQRLPAGDRAPAEARAADRLRAAGRPARGRSEPMVESAWIEPYPDEQLGLDDGLAGPDARYEQRESVELAFIAALQHLPARQRAVLILRDVLGFSGARGRRGARRRRRRRSTARCSGPTGPSTPSCPSAASRRRCARSATRRCARSSTATSQAWERNDVDAIVAMLTESAADHDASDPTWYRGPRDGRAFLARVPLAAAAAGG